MVERNLEKMTAELQEWAAELKGKLETARRKFEEENAGITSELARVQALIRAASGKVIQPEVVKDGQKKKRNRKPIPRDQLLTPEELTPILENVLKEGKNLGEKEIFRKVADKAKEQGKATVGLFFRVKKALKARGKN